MYVFDPSIPIPSYYVFVFVRFPPSILTYKFPVKIRLFLTLIGLFLTLWTKCFLALFIISAKGLCPDQYYSQVWRNTLWQKWPIREDRIVFEYYCIGWEAMKITIVLLSLCCLGSCVFLSCVFLSCLCSGPSCLAFLVLSVFWSVLFGLALPCLVLPCLILFVLSCLVLSYLVSSCLILSCLPNPYSNLKPNPNPYPYLNPNPNPNPNLNPNPNPIFAVIFLASFFFLVYLPFFFPIYIFLS